MPLRWLASICVTMVISAAAGCARAAVLEVLCAEPLRGVAVEIARGFVKGSGHRVEFIFGSAAALHKRAALGQPGDVLIGTLAGVEALAKLGRALPASVAPVARAGLAIAVRSQARRPDVSTPEALRETLRGARSIGVPDPAYAAQGGSHVLQVFDQIGIADEIRLKLVRLAPADALKRVSTGELELAFALTTEIAAFDAVALAGELPASLRSGVTFAAVVLRNSKTEAIATRFVAFLASERARGLLKAAGWLVPD